jgi:hypothetical protein
VLPGAQGRFYLASGWNIRRPIEEWKRSDFYGHSGELADEAAFRAKVEENADHQRERRALGRREITLERQPEIDALSRKLARQDRAIAAFRQRHHIACAAA